jgi:tetratricopeptide (TPR) repeat protein
LKTESTDPSGTVMTLARSIRVRRAVAAVAIATASAAALVACGGPAESLSVNRSLTAGIAAQRAGDYGTATSDYAMVLRSEPMNAYALYDLGDAEQFQHQDAAASAHYQQALSVMPTMENALYNLAILDSATNPRVAKALYLRVLALFPKDAVAHLNLGRVLLALGEKRSGNAQINLAINLEPSLRSVAPPTS